MSSDCSWFLTLLCIHFFSRRVLLKAASPLRACGGGCRLFKNMNSFALFCVLIWDFNLILRYMLSHALCISSTVYSFIKLLEIVFTNSTMCYNQDEVGIFFFPSPVHLN